MRVLMVTPMLPYPETVSAGPLGMYGTLSVLRQDHAVTLASFAGPDPGEWAAIEQLRRSGLDVHAVWRREPSGIRRWTRRGRLLRGWLRGTHPLRTLEFTERDMQRMLDRLLAGQVFDLIQIEDNAMANYRYPSHIPLVLNEHEVRVPSPLKHGNGRTAKAVRSLRQAAEWRRWERYQRKTWQRVDRVQVFTGRDAAAVRQIAPEVAERVRVNPFGIWLPPAGDLSREEAGMIVFIGGFGHGPNVDAALWLGHEIMPLLRATRPGIRLFIVGDQPSPEIRSLASDDIIVTGRVPAIEPFLDRAAVVLAPLRLGGGMRMKVLQAMAAGKAVVATRLAAEGLAFGHAQPPLILADEAAAIAEATARLIENPEARHELGRQARGYIEQYLSWEGYGRRLASIYNELLPARSAD